MEKLTSKEEYDLNNSNVANQNAQTGTRLNALIDEFSEIPHNDLVEIQGGETEAFYHLTEEEHAKIYRADNVYTGNCIAYQFDIHYEIDTLGSRGLYTK